MPNPKLFLTIPLMIFSLPFLLVGVFFLFLVLAIKPPASWADKLIDRLIDGPRNARN